MLVLFLTFQCMQRGPFSCLVKMYYFHMYMLFLESLLFFVSCLKHCVLFALDIHHAESRMLGVLRCIYLIIMSSSTAKNVFLYFMLFNQKCDLYHNNPFINSQHFDNRYFDIHSSFPAINTRMGTP